MHPRTLSEKILTLDNKLSQQMRVAERPGNLRVLAIILAHSGNSWFWGLGLVLIWALGPPDWKYRAVWMLVVILVTAVLVFVIKFSVRRGRPEGEWGGIYRRTDPHSFPSGHAARAAMLAVISALLGPPWLGWILAIWAPLVMLARVAMGVHYLTDVLAGALLGTAVGFSFWWIIPWISSLV